MKHRMNPQKTRKRNLFLQNIIASFIIMRKISSTHKFSFKINQILGFLELKDHTYPKSNEAIFSFPEFVAYLVAYLALLQLFIIEIHLILENRNQIDHTHFWPFPPKTYLNSYQHEKNQTISLICSGDFVLLKILQSDKQRAFLPMFQEQDFYQT